MLRHKALVAYVGAPHAGYLSLFRKHKDAVLYVLGSELIAEFGSLRRNLPGVLPGEAIRMISSLKIFSEVHELGHWNMDSIRSCSTIVMPDEDVTDALAEKYFPGISIVRDGSWRLRWDWKATVASRRPECETIVSHTEFDRMLLTRALGIGQKSPDWWRQIGALLVRDGTVLLAAFNKHLPSEQTAYLMGDPRSHFKPGEHIDASLAAHAEASLIAVAASRGIRTEGCNLYLTTFPCPPCAYSIADAKISRLFYIEGYSKVEGAASLVEAGVQIIRVEMNTPPT